MKMEQSEWNVKQYGTKKLMVKKRIAYPTYHYYGNITEGAMQTLRENFKNTKPSMNIAASLRLAHLDDGVLTPEKMIDYNQYDIQWRRESDENVEENYSNFDPVFQPVYDELAYMLKSPVCRLRYSTIETNNKLDWHMDQPGKDRFSVVIDGEQVLHVRTKQGEFHQIQKPGEVWYLNSNWDHKVENTGTKQRLALLGCFEYNSSN